MQGKTNQYRMIARYESHAMWDRAAIIRVTCNVLISHVATEKPADDKYCHVKYMQQQTTYRFVGLQMYVI